MSYHHISVTSSYIVSHHQHEKGVSRDKRTILFFVNAHRVHTDTHTHKHTCTMHACAYAHAHAHTQNSHPPPLPTLRTRKYNVVKKTKGFTYGKLGKHVCVCVCVLFCLKKKVHLWKAWQTVPFTLLANMCVCVCVCFVLFENTKRFTYGKLGKQCLSLYFSHAPFAVRCLRCLCVCERVCE